MSLSDPIGDMIARIKNAQMRNHKKVELPSSNFKVQISEILKTEGFIVDYKVDKAENKPTLQINLKYYSGRSCNKYHRKSFKTWKKNFF